MEQGKSIFEKNDLDLGRWESLSKELEEYAGKSIGHIEKEYFEKIRSHREFSNICKDEDDIAQFYQSTDHYLYELLYWEGCKSKYIEFRKLLLFIKKYKLKKILDYGGGVGGFCIYLNNYSVSCDYLDLPGRTSDFASWRFKNRNMKNKMFLSDMNLPRDAYDLVVSYDVLEHVYDVENIIKGIGNLIVQNGYFVCKCSFAGGRLHLAKNEKYQDIKLFSNMLEKNNLKFYGRIKPNFIFGIRINKRLKYGGNWLIFKKSI